MNKIFSIFRFFVLSVLMLTFFSCEDFMTTDSNRYVASDNYSISSPNDTVYSILGILAKVNKLADKNVLIGELRADMMDVTSTTRAELRDLSNFAVDSTTNSFADARDYYAVINNCNYFIQKADTSLVINGNNIFNREINVAKTIRAWTYLQIGLNYGKAAYYHNTILTTSDLKTDIKEFQVDQLVDSLISEVKSINPETNTDLPAYGSINGVANKYLFLNPLYLLGDLYLWKASYSKNVADYEEAATYYAKLIELNSCIIGNYSNSWSSDAYTNMSTTNTWGSLFTNLSTSSEFITILKPTLSSYNGVSSSLFALCKDLEISASKNFYDLSNSQDYCYKVSAAVFKYTKGDLRKKSILTSVTDSYTGSSYDLISKFSNNVFMLQRVATLYLRYAEAVNRAGKPGLAFAVLKYGLNSTNLTSTSPVKVPRKDLADQKPYTQTFYSSIFDSNLGIHSRGSGSSENNALYIIPDSTGLKQLQLDSIQYVENAICDELALETTFDGNRFQDLMRISNHRNQPEFLAAKVAQKHSENYSTFFDLLRNKKNWYLPLKR